MKTAALLLLVSTAAYADDEPVWTESAPASVTSSACDAVRGTDTLEGACKKLARKKVAGIGAVAMYTISSPGDYARYALVIGGLVSPPIDLYSESAMGGKHDQLGKVRARLRAIQVKGKPAVAIDVVAHFTHDQTSMDDGKLISSGPFTRYEYMVCAADDQGVLDCSTAGFGGPWDTCTARLSDDGVLTHACEVDDEVSFVPAPG